MLQRDVHLPADTDEVWEAITDPERLADWFGASVEWDLRPGGHAAFRQPYGDREGHVDGVEPGRRLTFTWWPTGERSEASEITYELDADDDGTHLTVTERPVERDASATQAMACAVGSNHTQYGAMNHGAGRWGVADDAMLTVWAASQAIAVG